MKAYLGLVVALSAIGCASEELDTSEKAQESRIICPDPEECTLTNGGGTLTQELGNAHIGPAANDLMLTHFINQPGGGVIVEGREYNGVDYFKQTSDWLGARYYGVQYGLVGIFESGTVPQFRLAREDGTTFNVTGPQIVHLELILEIKPAFWTISFLPGVNHGLNSNGQDDGLLSPGPGSHPVTLHAFDMFWNVGQTRTQNPQPYCHLAKINANTAPDTDPVVFQQGISVSAVDADMATPNNYVTLSCLHGAPATVAWWGYDYHVQADLFEAAMHMKRASFCGDDTFYTRRNTTIMIRDTIGNLTNIAFDPLEFEASWGRPPSGGPIRALCVNRLKQRRFGSLYPPHSGVEFARHCTNASDIPDCSPDESRYPPIGPDPGDYGPLASQRTPQSP